MVAQESKHLWCVSNTNFVDQRAADTVDELYDIVDSSMTGTNGRNMDLDWDFIAHCVWVLKNKHLINPIGVTFWYYTLFLSSIDCEYLINHLGVRDCDKLTLINNEIYVQIHCTGCYIKIITNDLYNNFFFLVTNNTKISH